jgi:hypothetical protein
MRRHSPKKEPLQLNEKTLKQLPAQSINFHPSAKQFKAWGYLTDNLTTQIGYGGGAAGGKSYLGAVWLVIMCLKYPGTGWLMGRKELTNLKRTTLITLFKVAQDFGINPDKDFKVNQQTNVITFKNGSQVFLMDLSYIPSDPLFTRLGGLELTGAFIDESNEVPEAAINILITRIGRRKNKEHGIHPKLLETFNPDKGHVYQRYYKPWKTETLPEFRKFITALPGDNPHTTPEYIAQLKSADKVTRERLLYGNFEYDDSPDALIQYDAILDLFTNSVESGESFIIADIARYGADSTVISLWKGLNCTKIEIYDKQATDETSAKIASLAAIERVPYSHILVDSDGVGGGVQDSLKGIKGFIANSKPTDKKLNYQNLKTQCAYKLAECTNDHRISVSAEITPTQKERLIEELQQIKSRDRDKDGKLKIISKDEVKENIGRSPDMSDVFLMRMLFEIKKPGMAGTVYPHQRGNVTTQGKAKTLYFM